MIQAKTPFTPEEVGYDSSRLEILNEHFETMIHNNEIQGASYCLARDGKVFANTALGKFSYRPEKDELLQPDAIFRIASITKLFCTVAIFQQVENGKIRLNQTVGEFIDEFNTPPFNQITIAHLLTHTSGMQADAGCFENKYFTSPWEFIEKDNGQNWIAASLKAGLRKKPGEEWAYCSFGFVILGEILSRVSGVFANKYIEEYICKPCEMVDTGFEWTKEIAKRMLVKNERTENRINRILADEKEQEGYWSTIPSTGGGLYSTAFDLCNFGTMLLNGGTFHGKRVLGRKTVEKMTTLYTTSEIKDFCWGAGGVSRRYALGPDLRCDDAALYTKGTFFHEGAGGCCLMIDPTEKLVASWFVPFVNDIWRAHGLYNVSAIMWSGLK